mgnify:CR=1 FL=1
MKPSAQLMNQAILQTRRRSLKGGLIGFGAGIAVSSILVLSVLGAGRRDMEWSEDILNLRKSVRNLEVHVKALEQQQHR